MPRRWTAMSKREQNALIAELVGWRAVDVRTSTGVPPHYRQNRRKAVPDFVCDERLRRTLLGVVQEQEGRDRAFTAICYDLVHRSAPIAVKPWAELWNMLSATQDDVCHAFALVMKAIDE